MLLRGDRGFPCGSAGNESACSARDLGLILKISWRRERLPTPVFPDNSVGKESACNAGDPGLIPGSGRSPGEGIGYPLQYSWASLVAQLVKNPPAMWRHGFDPWVVFSGISAGNESACNAGDLSSIKMELFS